jgi:hypothetical protein
MNIFQDIIAVYCENHVKPVNAMCRQNRVVGYLKQMVNIVTAVFKTLVKSGKCLFLISLIFDNFLFIANKYFINLAYAFQHVISSVKNIMLLYSLKMKRGS